MISHTGTILGATTTDKHHTVLRDVVALAGDVGRDDLAGGQADTSSLALARVGLLGTLDADLDAHALERRRLDGGQGGGDGVTGSLGFAAALGGQLVSVSGSVYGGEMGCTRVVVGSVVVVGDNLIR